KRAGCGSPVSPVKRKPLTSKKTVFIAGGVRYNCWTDRCVLPTWSLSQMRRFLQYSLGAVLLSLAMLLSLLPDPESTATAFEQTPTVAPAEHKAYTETIPGSTVKFDMVPIPGGPYFMGSPASEPGRQADESPQHPVTIRPFWMGKTEVTWDEYDLYWK